MTEAASSAGCLGLMLLVVAIVIGGIMLIEAGTLDVAAVYNQGMEDLTMERYVSAIEEFDKILKINVFIMMLERSYRAQAYIGRGRAKTALRNYDLAIKDFDKALKLYPEHKIKEQAYFYRANALESLTSEF